MEEFDDIAKPLRLINPGNIDAWNRVYATLEEANLDIPNTIVEGRSLREGKFVQIGTLNDKQTHWWNGGHADINLVPYTTDVKAGSITPVKTTFFETSKNIFNKDEGFIDGSTVNASTGVVQTNPTVFSYRVYNLMPIEGGKTYITNSSQGTFIYEYDGSGAFIKSNAAISGNQTITTNVNTRYMRVWRWQTFDNSTFQISEGTVSPPFTPFGLAAIKTEYLGNAITKEEFDPESVVSKVEIGGDVSKVVLTNIGKNIFNKSSSVLFNSQISGTNGAVQTNGSFTGGLFLDYMEVEPNTTYISNSVSAVSIAEYNASKVWIRNPGNISGATTFTTSLNARFIRVWMFNGTQSTPTQSFLDRTLTLQIEKGTISTFYEPFKLEIDKPMSENAISQSLSIVNNNLSIPSKLYLLKGVENDISYKPLTKKWNPFLFPFRITGTGVKSQNERVKLTPSTSQVLKAELYNDDFRLIESKNITTHVGDPLLNTGIVNVLTIGDSHTEPGFFQASTRALIPSVVFLGTRRGNPNVNPIAIHSEGRSGWSLQNYFNSAFFNDITNFNTFQQPTGSFSLYYGPTQTWRNALTGTNTGMWYDTAVRVGFDAATGLKLNPAIGDVMYVNANSTYKYWDGSSWINTTATAIGLTFNMSKYRQAFLIPTPKIVSVMLGINDFSSLHPDDVLGQWATWKGRMDTIIASTKLDNPDVKFAICLPMSYFPDHIDNDVNSFSRMKSAAMFEQRKLLIRDFDNREAENIYLVDFSSALDSQYGFHMEYQNPFPEYLYSGSSTGWNNQQRPVMLDNVHPDENGHRQYARVFGAFIQAVR